MLLSSQFNVNYFAISEVDQWFTDFADEYSNIGARQIAPFDMQWLLCHWHCLLHDYTKQVTLI